MHDPAIHQLLTQAAASPHIKDLQQLWVGDCNRLQQFKLETESLYLDLSKNWIDNNTVQLLQQLAESCHLNDAIDKLLGGEVVNSTDQTAAGHTTLRNPRHHNYQANLKAMFDLADRIESQQIKTAFDKPIKQWVNIGIGGSYLGPRLVVEALTELQSTSRIPVFFAASVDDSLINQLFKTLDIEHCLFCISSKSFGTVETLMNARAIEKKLKSMPGYHPQAGQSSLMAITAKADKARQYGIDKDMILSFDDSIGGRFSLWSTIGFPIVMAAGKQAFKDLLAGAHQMDEHFRQAPVQRNLPVMMALLAVWYRNYMQLSAYGCLPYDARLRCLPQWLQQLMMESTGKMYNNAGQAIDYPTAPWVFGDHGQLSQHAFFQAFHQGLDALPLDFIGVIDESPNQQFLLYNMLAQSAALMQGRQQDDRMTGCPGNKPSTTLLLKRMDAKAIGELLAMYEHMVYTQSVIWDINCFDQPGVELGKAMAKNIQEYVTRGSLNQLDLDPSTVSLINQVSPITKESNHD
ncbi:MAG: glucose-6-phosphate isomerase [Proteobacteria bacterium]|nr:MAG: glucose-6-phosphate isomerase [Pseudomonadota bacterium]